MTTSTTMTAQVRSGGKILFILLAIASGLLLCVQSRINGALGAKLGDAIAASTISFGVGLAALVLLAIFVPAVRGSVAQVPRALAQGCFPRWYLVAGAVGALIVFSQAAAVPLIGVALFTVCLVTGQAIGSMFMDRVGFGGAAPRKINALRILGVVLTIIGVVWAVSPRGADADLSSLLLPMALSAAVGMLMGFQAAANGAQAAAYGGATAATLVNFAVGFVVLAMVMLVRLPAGIGLDPLPGTWWYYIGGLLGCLFVGITALVVKRLGVLVTSLAAVGGQLVGSLLLDVFFPATGSSVTAATVMGTLLTLLAVGLASISGARNAKSASPRIPVASRN
ncbi:DMT family transporter [Glutamicibacter sp. NPDC055491]